MIKLYFINNDKLEVRSQPVNEKENKNETRSKRDWSSDVCSSDYPQNMIQAFSRTNRIYDNTKQWGQIVTFQYPETYKKKIDEAIQLYSNGAATSDITAPVWTESRKKYIAARNGINQYLLDKKALDRIVDAPIEEMK